MLWEISYQCDLRAGKLADRHYSRKTIGSRWFTPPGRKLVLLTPEADALWVTSYPFAEFVKHEWAGAYLCTMFRNESAHLSSRLITQAVAATRWRWPDVPDQGMVTFVNQEKVKPSTNPGYCFKKAGFRHVGHTKSGLVALQLATDEFPPAEVPVGANLGLPI